MPQTHPRGPARAELVAGIVAVALVGVLVVLGVNRLSSAAPDARASTSAAPSSSPPSAPTPTPPLPTPPTWPISLTESDLFESTGTVWAVWLDVTPFLDQSDQPLPFEDELDGLGYTSSSLPVVCLDGSLEQLGLADENDGTDLWGSPVYFGTEADAQSFVTLWDRPVIGVTEGSIACDWG